MTSKYFYQFPHEIIDKDIEKYKKDSVAFQNGEIHPVEFKSFRVPCGVYEQRTENTFMVRIKTPAGGLTAEQMKAVARLSKEYGNGITHVTTRQEIQIHWVSLTNPPLVMEELKKVGLTTKGGGGNTVRNVTACYDAGVCPKEVFDVAPYAIAVAEHMLPDPISYSLPRKFKIAFAGCGSDCSFATINDMGLIAKKKLIDGKEVRGFKLYMGGGMGAYSRLSDLFEEFIPADEILYYAEALKIFFDKNGNRKTKHKARLRFLLDKLGHDEFRKQIYGEVDKLKKEKNFSFSLKDYPHHLKPVPEASTKADISDPEYQNWLNHNTEVQTEPDYFMVKIRLNLGDISADDLIKLSSIVEDFGEGTIRLTQGQNMVIRWVHKNELAETFTAIKNIGLAGNITKVKDLVCCAGAATCKLGIGLSRGLSRAVIERLDLEGDRYNSIKDVRIRVSGCPNSCGQHPIAQIGLHGIARRAHEHMTLFYKVLIGGRTEEDKSALAKETGIVPAKNIPEVIARFLNAYLENRQEGEDYYQFLERAGHNIMKKITDELSLMPTYEQNSDYYRDWGSDTDFSMAGIGPGECGAGVFDLIEVDLKEAKNNIEAAKNTRDDNARVAQNLLTAMVHASKALLVTRGAEAGNKSEALSLFASEFIQSGIADNKYQQLLWSTEEFLQEDLTEKAMVKKFDDIEAFANMVSDLYKNMDDSLRFKTKDNTDEAEKDNAGDDEGSGNAQVKKSDKFMDLRGVLCPFNYVKAKIALETIEIGQILEILLDDGEPINNVPGSLKNDGQLIHVMDKIDDKYYRLVIEKKA